MPPSHPRRKLLLTRKLPAAVEKRAAEDYDVRLNENDRQLEADSLVERASGMDAPLVCAPDPLAPATIERPPGGCRAPATFPVAPDHTALPTAPRPDRKR